MAKKDLASKAKQATNKISGLSEQTKQVADSQFTQVKFTKPNGDYYKLDLVLRDTVMGNNKHMITTETIKRDYKAYLKQASAEQGTTITKYIHDLIEQDAKNKGYSFE